MKNFETDGNMVLVTYTKMNNVWKRQTKRIAFNYAIVYNNHMTTIKINYIVQVLRIRNNDFRIENIN